VAGARLAGQGQRDRSLRRRRGQVLGADGVAVHRRIVEALQSRVRDDVLGQVEAERLAQRHLDRGQRRGGGEHRGAGVLERGGSAGLHAVDSPALLRAGDMLAAR